MFFMLGTSVAQDKGDGKDEGNVAFGLQFSNPADGGSVFSVNFIQLVFTKDITVTLPEGGIDVKNNTTGDVLKITRLNDNPYLDKNTVVFMFEQKSVVDKDGKEQLQDQYLDAPGEYSYTIPAGCIKSVDGEDFEKTFTFKITAPLTLLSVSPNSGVTKLDKIELTFDKPVASANINGMSIVDNYWMPVTNIKSEATFSDDRKTVTLELENPITEPGTYNLDIYQSVFVGEDGSGNEYKSLSFQVIDTTPSFATNLKDGDKVKELPEYLEFTFKNVNEVKLVEGADPVSVVLPGYAEVEGVTALEGNKVVVTFGEKFTEVGKYEYWIPNGLFTMDGVPNEAFTINVTLYKFEITPLEVVSVTPAAGNVNQIDKIVVEFNQPVALSYDENWQQISREITLKGDTKDYVLTYAPAWNVSNKVEYLVNAKWNGYDAYESTPLLDEGTYTLSLKDIVVDYAGESYVDEWGGTNTNWHVKNACVDLTYTWTISGGGTPDVPTPEIDLTKAYRVKDVVSGKYLHVGDYEAHPGGVNGGVKVEAKEESGDQIFTIEEAGNGQYYLKSQEGHYIVCRAWNVDGSKDEKTALGFEFTSETEFYITNTNGYFKVQNIGGVDYPFCDAKIDLAATWVLEEAGAASGIEDITAGDVVKTIYDLTGRRIENITNAGIYIVNGKKVLVK